MMMMSIVVNTNTQSLSAQRLLGNNTRALGKTLEKLSSGYKINRASDDAAGLQISETLRAQIRGSQQANNNVQDGINVLNTAEGAFDTITNNLQRVRELVVQGGNDTLSAVQRSAINSELLQLASDITRIANSTQFNNKNLLDGTQASLKIQVGANSTSATNVIDIGANSVFASATASSLGLFSSGALVVKVNTNASALKSLSIVDAALQTVNNRRAAIGALTNRLDGASNNLNISVENFSASESRIRNTDIAKESANLTKNQVLQQASAQILGQANQTSQLALSLLRG
jgi:flagellin